MPESTNQNAEMGKVMLGGMNEMQQRERLMAALRGSAPQDYRAVTADSPHAHAMVEQYRPAEDGLDPQYTFTHGDAATRLGNLMLGLEGSQYSDDFYSRQNVGARGQVDLPVGDMTVSPMARVGAHRVPGEWGTQGWKSDPVMAGGRVSAPVGDGAAYLEMLAQRGMAPAYEAGWQTPIGSDMDVGAAASSSRGEKMRDLQLLLHLKKRF